MMKCRTAFSLIELLIVIAVIAILVGLLMGGFSLARRQADFTEARTIIAQLDLAVRTYRQTDPYQRFPRQPKRTAAGMGDADESSVDKLSIGSDPAVSNGILTDLTQRGGFVIPSGRLVNGLLLDPWGEPYFYALGQSSGNYSVQSSLTAAGFSTATTNLPADWKPPYIWSTARKALRTNAKEWVTNAAGPP